MHSAQTNIIHTQINHKLQTSHAITTDMSAIYHILRTNPSPSVRVDAAAHLLKLADDGVDIFESEIKDIYDRETDINVAISLKRLLNKIKIQKQLTCDPTAKYDRKLSPEEEKALYKEIDRLKNLYDEVKAKKGAFNERYKIHQLIATGGMGRVFKGIRISDNKLLAFKFLMFDDLSLNNNAESIVSRFKREADIMMRLNHPNIVKAYEYGESDKGNFIVMDFVDGQTLLDMIGKGLLNIERFKTISLQLCDVIAFLHNNSIIHRDIKPDNILIVEDKNSTQVKICDFGLSLDKERSRLSKCSFSAGNSFYSSPQQLEDARNVDERDDIFSLGKTFYEMLTGNTFKYEDPYIPINQLDKEISSEIDSIILKCIAEKKEDRYQSVSDLRNAILGI